jgi:hypothetical protein
MYLEAGLTKFGFATFERVGLGRLKKHIGLGWSGLARLGLVRAELIFLKS